MSDYYDNYATERVPETATTDGLRVGMVAGLLAFAVPGLAAGPIIVGSLGIEDAIITFVAAGVALSVIGSITGYIGYRNRLSSYMMITRVFGAKGAAFLNILLAFSLLGWFGVNMDLLSAATTRLLADTFQIQVQPWMIEALVGAGITITAIWGFRLLEKLSSLIVPLLAVMTAYMAYRGYVSWDTATPDAITYTGPTLTLGQAITAIFGSFVVSVVLMADFTRFVRKAHDVVTASFVPYLGLATFSYMAAALAGLAVGRIEIVDIMLLLGLGNLALGMVIISSWLTNVVNLYSCSLSLTSVFAAVRERHLIIAAGVLGTGAASLNLLDQFTDFLFGLSVIFAPVSGVLIADYFIIRRQREYQLPDVQPPRSLSVSAVLAWGGGIMASFLTTYDVFSLTYIEAIDGIIWAFALHSLFDWKKRASDRATAHVSRPNPSNRNA